MSNGNDNELVVPQKGKLFTISGSSGCGKGLIISTFFEMYPGVFDLSKSCTTRAPRADDKDNYFYKSTEEFMNMIQKNELLEYDMAANDKWYGTPKKPVFDKLESGKNVLLEINYVGALHVKSEFPQTVTIFLLPPRKDILLARLVNRGKLPLEEIINRFEKAPAEISKAYRFDYIIVNDKVLDAASKFKAIFDSHNDPTALTEAQKEVVEQCKANSRENRKLMDRLLNEFYDREKLINMINVLSDYRDKGIAKSL